MLLCLAIFGGLFDSRSTLTTPVEDLFLLDSESLLLVAAPGNRVKSGGVEVLAFLTVTTTWRLEDNDSCLGHPDLYDREESDMRCKEGLSNGKVSGSKESMLLR